MRDALTHAPADFVDRIDYQPADLLLPAHLLDRHGVGPSRDGRAAGGPAWTSGSACAACASIVRAQRADNHPHTLMSDRERLRKLSQTMRPSTRR
jgi:hypothetical protein